MVNTTSGENHKQNRIFKATKNGNPKRNGKKKRETNANANPNGRCI